VKSLEDFQKDIKEIVPEAIQYAINYKMVPVTDEQGKVRYKKQRIGRLVLAKKNSEEDADTQVNPEFEVADTKPIKEAKESNFDPPYVLVLKRQSIRLFPNNTKVALYYNEKLNKTFSVPYGPGMNPIIQAESLLNNLNFSEDSKGFLFESGESIEILHHEAESLLNLYNKLNESNRKRMLNSLCESKNSFNKILKFAINK
jgi:hypothetical protein